MIDKSVIRYLYDSLYNVYILNNVNEVVTVRQNNIINFIDINSELLYNITFSNKISTRNLVSSPLYSITVLDFFKKNEEIIMSDNEITRNIRVMINITLSFIELINSTNFKYKYLHNYITDMVEVTVVLIKLLKI